MLPLTLVNIILYILLISDIDKNTNKNRTNEYESDVLTSKPEKVIYIRFKIII